MIDIQTVPVAGLSPWTERGKIDIGDILDENLWTEIETEARGLASQAQLLETRNVASHRDGSFASPSHFYGHGGGPLLVSVLRAPDMLNVVREASGLTRLVPVRCAYNFYRPGDYIGVHRDSVKSTVTVSFSLTPDLPAMGWAPTLREASSEALAAFVAQNGKLPVGQESLEIPYCAMVCFDGYNIPHWRPTCEADLGILGTLSFFDL